jgi:hypothetical protein
MSFKVVMLLLSEEPNTWFKKINTHTHQVTVKEEKQAEPLQTLAFKKRNCSCPKHSSQIV